MAGWRGARRILIICSILTHFRSHLGQLQLCFRIIARLVLHGPKPSGLLFFCRRWGVQMKLMQSWPTLVSASC